MDLNPNPNFACHPTPFLVPRSGFSRFCRVAAGGSRVTMGGGDFASTAGTGFRLIVKWVGEGGSFAGSGGPFESLLRLCCAV